MYLGFSAVAIMIVDVDALHECWGGWGGGALEEFVAVAVRSRN